MRRKTWKPIDFHLLAIVGARHAVPTADPLTHSFVEVHGLSLKDAPVACKEERLQKFFINTSEINGEYSGYRWISVVSQSQGTACRAPTVFAAASLLVCEGAGPVPCIPVTCDKEQRRREIAQRELRRDPPAKKIFDALRTEPVRVNHAKA